MSHAMNLFKKLTLCAKKYAALDETVKALKGVPPPSNGMLRQCRIVCGWWCGLGKKDFCSKSDRLKDYSIMKKI